MIPKRFKDFFRPYGPMTQEDFRSLHEGIFIEDELIELGFTFFRDALLLTDRRLLLISAKGLIGDKVHYVSVPYGGISRFSVEASGTFDRKIVLKIWGNGEGAVCVSRKMAREDVYEAQRFLLRKIQAKGFGSLVSSNGSGVGPI